jgi:hypothetical protein
MLWQFVPGREMDYFMRQTHEKHAVSGHSRARLSEEYEHAAVGVCFCVWHPTKWTMRHISLLCFCPCYRDMVVLTSNSHRDRQQREAHQNRKQRSDPLEVKVFYATGSLAVYSSCLHPLAQARYCWMNVLRG